MPAQRVRNNVHILVQSWVTANLVWRIIH